MSDYQQLCKEHGELVDKHLTEGISNEEAARLVEVRNQLDALEATRLDVDIRSWGDCL